MRRPIIATYLVFAAAALSAACSRADRARVTVPYVPMATAVATASPTPTPTPISDIYSRTILADGPSQYYEFEEAAGSVAKTSLPGQPNATYVGVSHVLFGLTGPILTSPSRAIGLSGGAASAGVLLPNPNVLTGTSYALEAWVYPLLGPTYITAWGYNGTHRLLVSSTGLLLTQFSGNFFSRITLSSSRWHYVIFQYNAAAARASYFVDGALNLSAPISPAAAAFVSPYYAGQYDTGVYYKWNGRLAQFALYKKALSGTQINKHYRAAGYATPTPQPDSPCNGYRWAIKVATDIDAPHIDLNETIATTIAALRQIPVPGASISTPRVIPQETAVYRIANVTLKQIFRAVDNDYHLVVSDAVGNTMIAESPAPSCAPSSTLAAQLQAVRTRINAAVPNVSPTPLLPNKIVTIQGVGFFDYAPNGAVGEAPNGIELHPITAICFGSNCSL